MCGPPRAAVPEMVPASCDLWCELRPPCAGRPDRCSRAGRHDHTPGAIERAVTQLDREQARALEWSGQSELARLLIREAELRVIGRVAEQDDSAVTARPGGGQRMVHQRGANP